jgi:hypothetical protein
MTMTTLYVLYRIIVLYIIIFLSLSVSTCHALPLNTNKNDHSSKNSLIARSSRKAAASNQKEQQPHDHYLLSRRQAMALVLGTATATLFRNDDDYKEAAAHAAWVYCRRCYVGRLHLEVTRSQFPK